MLKIGGEPYLCRPLYIQINLKVLIFLTGCFEYLLLYCKCSATHIRKNYENPKIHYFLKLNVFSSAFVMKPFYTIYEREIACL